MKVIQKPWLALLAFVAVGIVASTPAAAQKKPNVVMLMSDDVGWATTVFTSAARRSGIPRRTSIAWPGKV